MLLIIVKIYFWINKNYKFILLNMWKGIWLFFKIFEDFRKEYNKLYICLFRGKNMKDEIRLFIYSGSY